MTAAELFTLGFLIVLGVGCITAAIHSINLPHRITTRYQAARKVQAAYIECAKPGVIVVEDVPREFYNAAAHSRGEVHVCNVDGNCAKGRAAR